MKPKLQNLPATKASIFIIVGLTAGLLFNAQIVYLTAVFLVTLLISIIATKNYRSAIYLALCLSIGILMSIRVEDSLLKLPEKTVYPFEAVVKARIIKEVKKKEKICKYIAECEVRSVYSSDKEFVKILITTKNDKSRHLIPGDMLYFKSRLEGPLRKNSKEQFDEKKYMQSQGVSWKTFVYNNYAIIGQEKTFEYYQYVISEFVRIKIRQLFNDEFYPLAAGIFLGDRTELDSEITKAFSYTGAVHLLSVSGLHVGIIAVVGFFITAYINNRWISFSVFLLLITIFTLISGLSAPGIRSAIMIVLYQVSRLLQRKAEAINILSMSMILILLFDPSQIYSIGFQLSYLAMYGIFIFYNVFNEKLDILINSKISLLSYIKKSTALTLSAGLFTTPLAAYYFEVYSIISPLSNLMLVPLFSLALIFIVISFLFSLFWSSIALIYASAAELLFSMGLNLNKFFEGISGSYIIGEIALPLSIIISLALMYLFYSNSVKSLAFRSLITLCISILAILNLPNDEVSDFEYHDYRYVEMYKQRSLGDTIVMYIKEKRPHQYPKIEFELMNAIKANKSTTMLFYDGNCGMAYSDEIKSLYNYKSYELKKQVDFIRLKEEIKIAGG